jgi:hypothetical protein
MFYRIPFLHGRESMVNLTKVHRIILEGSRVQFIYLTPDIQNNNFKYTYCFNTELKARNMYDDIQLTLAKNGKLVDNDGMLK